MAAAIASGAEAGDDAAAGGAQGRERGAVPAVVADLDHRTAAGSDRRGDGREVLAGKALAQEDGGVPAGRREGGGEASGAGRLNEPRRADRRLLAGEGEDGDLAAHRPGAPA